MILALRALGIGDLATAVPALRGLRRAFPGDELVLAAPAWLAPLVALVGAVDRLLPVPGLAASLHGAPTTCLAVNLHGRGPQSHQLLRPRPTWAFACPAADFTAGPRWRSHEHEVTRWCRLLQWYDIAADPADLELTRPDPDGRPTRVTVVHVGAKAAERRWPARRFAAVARRLADQGHDVVVTGSAAERDLARHVAAAAGLGPDAVLAGRTDLDDLACLVAHARLVISGDTGVGHLATAYRTPSVLLFGPVSPSRWGPPPDRAWHRALWPIPAGTDGPAAATVHPVLGAIEPADVLQAVAEVERVTASR